MAPAALKGHWTALCPQPSSLSPPLVSGSVESGRKLHVIPRAKKGAEGQPPGHSSHVLCMAISSDGKYLVRQGRTWAWVRGMGVQWVLVAIVLVPTTGLRRSQQTHSHLGGPELPSPAHFHRTPGRRVGEELGLRGHLKGRVVVLSPGDAVNVAERPQL